MNITHLKEYLTDLSRFGATKDFVEIIEEDDEKFRFYIYTEKNRYHISATARVADGYLGCTVSARTPRAGEDYTRGNDLHDGKLNAATWHGILADIISFEMVALAPKREPHYQSLQADGTPQ